MQIWERLGDARNTAEPDQFHSALWEYDLQVRHVFLYLTLESQVAIASHGKSYLCLLIARFCTF
jgi:hypothetical protein